MNIEIKPLKQSEEARACAEFMASSEPWLTLGRTLDDCLKLLNEPAKEIYVVRCDKGLAGFVVLQLHGPFTGYIQTIGVVPEWRNRGVGTRLMDAAGAWGRTRGAIELVLTVWSGNAAAESFYRRLGYREVSRALRRTLTPGSG